MTAFYTLLLIAVSFALGLVVGEMRAPISGVTVQALSMRAAGLEQRLEILSARYDEMTLAADGSTRRTTCR